jgi:putative nucleotidyltransferase with HDIG domain
MDLKKAHIMIVEEHDHVVKIMKEMLSDLGFKMVTAASSGEEALVKAKEHCPNLVFLDAKLNGTMNSIEAAERIQEQFLIPVIFLTDQEKEGTLLKKKLRNPFGILEMPFDTDELRSSIEKALRRNEVESQKKSEEDFRGGLKRLRKVMEGTIQALSLVVETRDPYTARHQKRVAHLACAIADEMGLPEDQINSVLIAGAIHDIGKIYLPAEILNKPGQLNGSEYSIIMNHPQVGYDILKKVEFPWPVAKIVLQHHERMNGTGYPYGLEGEEIMLEARILAVADAVEAMSFERPHRKELGVGKALDEISRERDLAYDIDVVNACLRLFRGRGYVFELGK